MHPLIPSTVLVICFIIIHLLSKSLSFKRINLRVFLSFSGGIGISYVFLHLLPTLPEGQEILSDFLTWTPDFLPMNHTIYMVSLLGLAIFYIMDRVIIRAWETQEITNPDQIESEIYLTHMAFFTLYNFMIGYLLAIEAFDELIQPLLFFIAFGLHFVTNDWSLRNHHENVYDTHGRWILAIGILFGWAFGVWIELHEVIVVLFEAFITGGMVLNVIKEELPSEREGSLRGFLSGIVLSSLFFWFL